MKNISKYLIVLFSLCFTVVCVARDLSTIAINAYSLQAILMRFMWAACIIVGIVFSAAAFSQYRIHRYNPKIVSLFTPIVYVILALLMFAIPFAHKLVNAEEISQPVQNDKSIIYQDDDYLDYPSTQ